jgi:PAS domain S-box-containing protein
MEPAGEIKRLQNCINDLISVLALPAIWSGSEPSSILGTLLDVLLTMLRLDFAYARLNDTSIGQQIELVRMADQRKSAVPAEHFGEALESCLTGDQSHSRRTIPDPTGDADISITSFALGLHDKVGVLVVGSRRIDFPTEVEQLLLRIATNQAAIGLEEARRSGEQKRTAEILEQRVAERTRQLTTVNDELRRSDAYLGEAQRLSHTGSFGWKPSTGEIIWSDETFRIFQYDRTTKPNIELIIQRVHPEDASLVQQTINRASQDRKDFEHECRLVMPDASVKYVHVVARCVISEAGDMEFVGAVMDITAAKRTEETLRDREEYLAEAQRLSHTGSWARVAATGEMRYWSEECYRVLGFDPRGELPCFETFLQRIHPDDQAMIRDTADRATREKAEYQVDYRSIHPNGDIRQIHTIGRPVFGPSGDLVEFVGTVMDVTDRKRSEEERERLRQAQADLAHINRVTTMGELTASLAHEIKQPITAAVTNARTCLRWLDRDAPEISEARQAAFRLVNDVTRASDIISRISFLFKKGAQQHELVDVNELAREMIALLHSETIRHSISIRSELAEDLPRVMADRVQLQQVFMNLMLNGIEAMNDAGAALELTIRSQRMQNGQLLISVSDTGTGLPQKPEEIFNAFFTTKPQGTGMGLPISRSIIESHGGRLWADSNSEGGASFHFTLPAALDSRHAAASSDTALSA